MFDYYFHYKFIGRFILYLKNSSEFFYFTNILEFNKLVLFFDVYNINDLNSINILSHIFFLNIILVYYLFSLIIFISLN